MAPLRRCCRAAEDNIIAKAWNAVSDIAAGRGVALPPVAVHLTKNLPVASGIGGGSSNAAAAMRGFLRLAGIETLDEAIMAAGLTIGADVPVCLTGKPCRMRGVGERITPLARFEPRHAILVNPMVEVSTPQVFRQLGLEKGQGFNAPITDESDAQSWRNDLTAPAMAIAPVIGDVIARLERLPGVTRAFMSGSGATCVALCDGENASLDLDPRWWMARTIPS